MSNVSQEDLKRMLAAGGMLVNLKPTYSPDPTPAANAHAQPNAYKHELENHYPDSLNDYPDSLNHPGGPSPAALPPAGPGDDDPLSAAINAAKASGRIGYTAGNPIVFPFRTPAEMFVFFHPELEPSEWQLEELHRLGGYLNLENPDEAEPANPTDEHPLLYNLVAANGSGKDTYILTPFVLWFISAHIRARIISTSATQDQLKLQTFKPIIDYAERVNERLGYEVFTIREFYVMNNLTGSELVGRVTNVPGRVEGFHPFSTPPNCKMAVVVNEAKTIEDEVYASFSRFTGYTHWVQVSSPGPKAGQFYRMCSIATDQECKLGEQWKRHITAFDCTHIPRTKIEQIKQIHGEDSYIYITGVLAQFYASVEDVVIPEALLNYPTPVHNTFGLEPAAGLDIAFSSAGDATQFSLWHGNKEVYHAEIKTDSADKLHRWILLQINHGALFGLKPENVYADGGGLGKPIISRVVEAGYQITTRRNEMAAPNKQYYANLGAEMYFRVKRLFEQRVLVQPTDKIARQQLTERKAKLSDEKQRLQLEPKAVAKGRLGYSPDRADAIVLALSGYPMDVLLGLAAAPSARDGLKRTMSPDEFAQHAADFAFKNVEVATVEPPKFRGDAHKFAYYARR